LLAIVDGLSGSSCALTAIVYPSIILPAYAALNVIVLSVRKGSWRQNNQCGHDAAEFDFHHHFACCTAAIITCIVCLRDSHVRFRPTFGLAIKDRLSVETACYFGFTLCSSGFLRRHGVRDGFSRK